MTKHIHANLMMQYAQDAIETDKPWERWELFLQMAVDGLIVQVTLHGMNTSNTDASQK